MLRVIGRKAVYAVPVVFIVSLMTFFLMELVPGDPAVVVAGPNADPELVAEIHEELGLDDPVVERYLRWLGDTVTGDLGRQLVPPRLQVSTVIAAALPVTLQVAAMALVIALAIAIPAALLSASKPGGAPDRLLSTSAYAVIAVPSFLLALLLIFFFVFNPELTQRLLAVAAASAVAYATSRIWRRSRAYPPGARTRYVLRSGGALLVAALLAFLLIAGLPDFPRQGFVRLTSDEGVWESVRSSLLPALSLAGIEAAVWMRLLRSDLMATLQEDFILAAKAKGMPRWRILVRDALRPSSFSLITVLGVSLGRLIGGAVIVEAIFNLRGMGTLMVSSIQTGDVPVVQAAVLLVAVLYVVVNATIDIAYGYLDPRIRRGRV